MFAANPEILGHSWAEIAVRRSALFVSRTSNAMSNSAQEGPRILGLVANIG